ncbi:MAG: hypothetical protein ACOC5T_01375 [Elusimicrobiota bacterium]
MAKKKSWFEVDKKGLEKILKNKPKSFLIYELIQNSWDESEATTVDVTVEKIERSPLIKVTVIDDSPEGFRCLSDAFTFYAESYKKKDPEKRGRFNIGEKFVLACCREASIQTTKGTIFFNEDGTRSHSKKKTKQGSVFTGTFKANQNDFDQICCDLKKLIPPDNKKTTINGTALPKRKPICSFVEQLPTVISDDAGNLKRSIRKTNVSVLVCKTNEKSMIYEMGIPVVETGDQFHVNIMQKVPLNTDRDNVPPSFLKTVRVAVLNNTIDVLDEDETTSTWVNEATGDKRCQKEVVNKAMDKKFGNKRVAYDPSDPEANKIAVSKGYTVVSGRMLSKEQWKNVKKSGAILPAGQVTPSKPAIGDFVNQMIPEDDWTNGMSIVAQYSKNIAQEIIDTDIRVQFINETKDIRIASFGEKCLTFNVARLGHNFFNNFPKNMVQIDELLIHELAHYYSSDHLDSAYYDALCSLGAKLKRLALSAPEVFDITQED